MTNETVTTIKLPNETLKKIKLLAIEKGTTQKRVINDLLNQALNKTENKSTGLPKARIINKEMPDYNPKRKGNLANIMGAAEVDEDIDVDKVLDNIHFKEELYK